MRERQEHSCGKDLPRLHALQAEAGEEAAPAEWSVLQDHRAGTRDFAGHRKPLDQAQGDQKDRRQHADLLIGRQHPHGHCREAHEEHAHEQQRLAAVRIAPMAQDEGANRPSDVADTVGRQGCDDGHRRVLRGEKDLWKYQRRRSGVDEEVIVFQRGADPSAGGGLARLVGAVRLVVRGGGHFVSSHLINGVLKDLYHPNQESSGGPALQSAWNSTAGQVRNHLFRIWTACAILAAYAYGWLYFPEILIWWKRTTTAVIEDACGLLPYPWNDRIEATLGNFGLWVQITLAIIAFRILVWLVMSAVRRVWAARGREPERLPPPSVQDSH